MTREEAVKVIYNEKVCIYRNADKVCDRDCAKCDIVLEDKVILEAYDMAISALEQEPICPSAGVDCEDCPAYEPYEDAVSLQAVINAIENDCAKGGLGSCFASYDDAQKFRGEIEKLPSVNIQRTSNAEKHVENTLDAISREAVLKEFEKGTENLYGRIDKLPSVTRQTGEWVIHPIYAHLVCSKCLSSAPYDCKTNYCPNCGARMVEPQESEEV